MKTLIALLACALAASAVEPKTKTNPPLQLTTLPWPFSDPALAQGLSIKTNVPCEITISLATNVSISSNQKGCVICESLKNDPGLASYHPAHGAEPFQPATAMAFVTNIVKRVTLQLSWNGTPLSYATDMPISSSTNRMKLVQEWRQE